MKAIARSLNAEIHVVKVKRRSDNMSLVADLLSKGHLDEARLRMEDPVMGHYSSTLAAWMSDPYPTRGLGIAIVHEIEKRFRVPIFETEWEDEYTNLIRVNRL